MGRHKNEEVAFSIYYLFSSCVRYLLGSVDLSVGDLRVVTLISF